MKFTADKQEFAEKLSIAARISASRSISGALSGVLISLRENNLTFTGYDMDAGIRLSMQADGLDDGDIIIAEPKPLSDIARKLAEDISLEVISGIKSDAKQIFIKSGRDEFRLPAIPPEEYPDVPKTPSGEAGINFKLPGSMLKSMLSQVNYAVGSEKENPELHGVRFESSENRLTLCGTDGVRLAIRSEDSPAPDFAVTVPEKAIAELIKHLSSKADGGEGDGEDPENQPVSADIKKNLIFFQVGTVQIFTRLLDDKYLNFRRICDFEPERIIEFNRHELLGSLEKLTPLISEKLRSPAVFEFSGGLPDSAEEGTVDVDIRVRTGSGDAKSPITARLISGSIQEGGNNYKIAFNPKYIADSLRAANPGDENVLFHFRKEFNPVKITSSGELRGYTFIVVPVRT